MPANWLEYSLGDLCSEITVGHVGSMTNEYRDSGIPFFRSKNIREYRIDWDDVKYISQSFHEKLKKSTLRPGDVAVVRTGKPGTACVIPDYIDEANCSDLVIMRVNPQRLSAYFLSYYLNSVANHQINSQLVGAVQQHFNVGAAKKLSITIPDRNEQERIVKVVKDLDDKIQLNHQINQTLEQIAQATFKSWFVDFEPVKAKIAALEAGGSEEDALLAAMQAISGKGDAELTRLQDEQPEQYAELRATAELFPSAMQDSELGEIPEGWSVTSVNEIAEIVKGKSYKSAELEPSKTALVTLKSFNRGGGYRLDGLKEYTGKYKPQQEVAAGDLIIAYTDVTQAADVIGKPAMVIGDERYEHLIISLDVAVIRPIDASLKPYLYGLAKTDRFQYHTKAHTTGTTVLHLAKNAVPEFQLALPSTDLIDAYAGQANPLFTLINEKVQENRSLESLRDTLLPKLLSGELEMLKIAENAEDA